MRCGPGASTTATCRRRTQPRGRRRGSRPRATTSCPGTSGLELLAVDFAQPTTGPLFKQLYVRQALQELIDQPEWIKQFLHGVGTVESGAVPTNFKTPFAGPAQRHLVYHYSPSAARKLLTSHGWKISSGAADVCVKPETGANECGAGIKGGAPLSFNLLYSSGIPAVAQESVAFQTSAFAVGIHVSLTSRPYDTVFADYFSCLGKPASAAIGT